MRIAHFSDSRPRDVNGVATSVRTSVELLRAAGHHVALHAPGPVWSRRTRTAGEVPSIPVPRRPYRMASPAFLIDAADLVHVHTIGTVGVAGMRYAAGRGVPMVLTWHTDLIAYSEHYTEIHAGAAYFAWRLGARWTIREYLDLVRPGPRRLTRLTDLAAVFLRLSAAVVVPSAKTAATLAPALSLVDRPPAVRVVPTPAVPAAAATDAARTRERLRIPAGAPVVLAVGRVSPEKNPDLLLRAFTLLRSRLPDAHLVLLGAQHHRGSVRRAAGRLGVGHAVRVLRPVPRSEVDAFYRAADVLAFPSTTDTQGLVLAEAEAVGLPVLVADGRLVHRPGGGPARPVAGTDAARFAAALHRLLTDRPLRREVIEAGLAAARGHLPRHHLAGLLAAYEEAVTAGRPESVTPAP